MRTRVPLPLSLTLIRGGSLFVAHGSADGLLPFVGYRISQDSFGIYDDVEGGDLFAAALAGGDFNGDGYDDLAIGVPGENVGSGAIEIIMGSQWGLIFANSVSGCPGRSARCPNLATILDPPSRPGTSTAMASPTSRSDLHARDLGPSGSYADTGSINVAYGAADPDWFDLSRTDHLAQSTIYGDEIHEGTDDSFGSAFGVGDFDGDGRDDLAIGHDGDDWGGQNLGAVTILMGATPNIGRWSSVYP